MTSEHDRFDGAIAAFDAANAQNPNREVIAGTDRAKELSYLAAFVASHNRYDLAKFRDILTKTAKNLSSGGRAAVLTLNALPPDLVPIVRATLTEPVARFGPPVQTASRANARHIVGRLFPFLTWPRLTPAIAPEGFALSFALRVSEPFKQ